MFRVLISVSMIFPLYAFFFIINIVSFESLAVSWFYETMEQFRRRLNCFHLINFLILRL